MMNNIFIQFFQHFLLKFVATFYQANPQMQMFNNNNKIKSFESITQFIFMGQLNQKFNTFVGRKTGINETL